MGFFSIFSSTKKTNIINILMTLCIFVMIFGLVKSRSEYSIGLNIDETTEMTIVDQNWYVQGTFNKTLPDVVLCPDGRVVLNHVITQDEADAGVVLFKNQTQCVFVQIGEELVYSLGEPGSMYGNSVNGFCVIRLPKESVGKPLSVVFFNCKDGKCDIPAFYSGSFNDAAIYLIRLDRITNMIFVVTVILAMILFVIDIMAFRGKFKDKRLISITWLLTAIAVWIFFNINTNYLFASDAFLECFISYNAFMMIPIPIALFTYTCKENEKHDIMLLIIALCILNVIIQDMLYLTDYVPLNSMLLITHILILTTVLSGFMAHITDYRKEPTVLSRLYILAYAIPVAIMVFGLIAIWIFKAQRVNNLLSAGLLFFVICLLIVVLFSIVDSVYEDRMKVRDLSLYHEMSVKDPLTELGNRRAFDSEVEKVEKNAEGDAILIFMDVNGLKAVNDQFGHHAGDLLLVGAASCIRNAYDDTGACFRLGGDEFAAIIEAPDREDAYYTELLIRQTAVFSEKSGLELTIAVGISHLMGNDGIKKSASLWTNQADKEMYTNKLRERLQVVKDEDDIIVADNVDELTGILTNNAFRRRVEALILQNPNEQYAIWYCDIKKFKFVNDLFGYEMGDQLLRFWAQTILGSLKEGEAVGRWAGDTMASFIKLENHKSMKQHFESIHEKVRGFLPDNGFDYNIDVAAGVYVLRKEDFKKPDINQMIDCANVAQKSVKNQRGSNLAIFDDAMWAQLKRELYLNQTLGSALANHDIFICLQPQYDYESGTIYGAEALCRWQHQELGLLFPGAFIKALENSGQITLLDYYVCEEAVRLIRKWMDEGRPVVPVSVNISRIDVISGSIKDKILSITRKYNVAPKYLHLEITESAYMDEPERLLDVIEELHEAGFIVEMDDFGSGFSSLNMLKEMSVDVLKLDMRFVNDTGDVVKGKKILKTVMELARVLELPVITEGIETKEYADFMYEVGCHLMQGYFYDKPLGIQAFEQRLDEKNRHRKTSA